MSYVQLAAGSGGFSVGFFGSGGLALAVTVYLFLRCRKGSSAKLAPQAAAVTGFFAGLLYMVAGDKWSAAGDISQGVTGSIQGAFANTGPAATALVLTIVLVYSKKLSPAISAFLGIVTATAYHQAGAVWLLPEGFVNNVIAHVPGLR
ncbi:MULTISPECIES: hypothetical protein [Streptomyces]|uniref:hypothetical protein n=1 Tax=Streptomyces TaxID=1883 RepID=UPI00345BBA69